MLCDCISQKHLYPLSQPTEHHSAFLSLPSFPPLSLGSRRCQCQEILNPNFGLNFLHHVLCRTSFVTYTPKPGWSRKIAQRPYCMNIFSAIDCPYSQYQPMPRLNLVFFERIHLHWDPGLVHFPSNCCKSLQSYLAKPSLLCFQCDSVRCVQYTE